MQEGVRSGGYKIFRNQMLEKSVNFMNGGTGHTHSLPKILNPVKIDSEFSTNMYLSKIIEEDSLNCTKLLGCENILHIIATSIGKSYVLPSFPGGQFDLTQQNVSFLSPTLSSDI